MAVGKTLTKSVAIIIGSSRTTRNGPRVASTVHKILSSQLPSNVNLKFVDLKQWNLPIFTESLPPMLAKTPEMYQNEQQREWSKEIGSYDGYIFLVPEYNGSYSGVLKNSFDYLYNEWVGKSAVIISYGGRTPDQLKGGHHFRDILDKMELKSSQALVKLSVRNLDREKTAEKEELVFYEKEAEEGFGREVGKAWSEMLRNMEAGSA